MKDKDIKRLIQLEKEARRRQDFGVAGRLRNTLKRAGVSFRGDKADYHPTKHINPRGSHGNPNGYNPNGPN